MPSSISTVSCVGVPSSSIDSEPAPPGDRAVIDHGDARRATRSPMRPEKALVPLRLKSPSRPWPTASCSSTPGQPGPSSTVISPAGRIDAVEVGQRLRQRLVDRAVPVGGIEQIVIEPAPAHAEAAGFAPAVGFGDDADVEAHQRADVGGDEAVGAHDLDHRPAAESWPDLATRGSRARAAASIVSSSLTFSAKGTSIERRGIGIEVAVVVARRRARALWRDRAAQRLAGAADRGGGNVVGMGKAGHLARNAAQAEARIARIVGGLQPAVVEAEALAGDELQIEFAIIAACSVSRASAWRLSGESWPG
jgi:hypothetical protein